ncbi:hypothetical protein [Chengkuizengella marina]|uniref:Uncharacterized protein n=1 Tax=Chengkuizengella marina TaxID=2507566 RepID=A0A6N9Q4Z4_9BACL|nr:hypothetical protein [Chengkuizengella marina]NBI29833.1 hypothetical protein [Chengkuizengella marina]
MFKSLLKESLLKKIKMSLPTSNSSTILELPDGRSEKLEFTQVKATQFTVSDSDFELKSGVNVELDIHNVNLEATSKVLWPGEKVTVKGGLESHGQALKGVVNIPINKTIHDGVRGESWLYWKIETPEGVLMNDKPIHMVGEVKGLPPQDSEFRSEDVITLNNEKGEFAGTIYNCCQSN